MKNIIIVFSLIVNLIVVFNLSSYGQNDDRFQINSPFKKSTFNGKQLRNMSNKELKMILSSDQYALAKYKNGNTVNGVGTALLCIGSFLVMYNTLQENNGLNDGSFESNQTLATTGLLIIASSIPFYIAGNSMRKNAIKGFRVNGKSDISMKINPIVYPSEKFMGGVVLSVRF